MSNFQKYSAFYDLLYQDKDYEAEAAYVARTLRDADAGMRSVLELGSGTGRHGRLMGALGFDVHGIERSPDMVAIANQSNDACPPGRFLCETGDICTVDLGRTFDAVVSLFHVISYQTSNDALLAAFSVAAKHLKLGGIFLFDVWHGPAVLIERPSERIKEVADNQRSVRRRTTPRLDTNTGIVQVVFDMECRDFRTDETVCFSEEHMMRYLFASEIDLLARASGFDVIRSEEFMTGSAPTPATWGVAYILKKNDA